VAGVGRWVNCLLIREIPFSLAVRLWDTYLAEGTRMREFLTYVLAAFLLMWAPQLKRMDFQVCAWYKKPSTARSGARLIIHLTIHLSSLSFIHSTLLSTPRIRCAVPNDLLLVNSR
jgi:hypothetical protein